MNAIGDTSEAEEKWLGAVAIAEQLVLGI